MSREWKPGDVALAEWYHEEPKVFLRVTGCTLDHHVAGDHWHSAAGTWASSLKGAEWHRPLVVIDPEADAQVERLTDAYEDARPSSTDLYDHMQAALRSLVTDPKPEEPQGLGAVVEDADGRHWVHARNVTTVRHWYPADGLGDQQRYEKITAVRVLSEGVAR